LERSVLTRVLARRLAGMVVTLALVSFLVFASLYVAPGDPTSFLLGRHTTSPAEIAAVRAQYHLNDPFFVRYWDWLSGFVRGDFGTSIVFRQSVASLIGPKIVTTVMLIVYASMLAILAGVGLGLTAAARGRYVNRMVLISTSAGVAIPSFVAAIFLLYVFSVQLGWFPSFGAGQGFADRIWHLTLPAVSLAVGSVALLARYTQMAVLEERSKEHVATAVARGLAPGEVFRRHVLRNSLIPITASAGIVVATMIVGVAIVETAFSLDGLGSYLIQALDANDFPVVQALALLFAAAYVILNTAVDLIYAALDPRVAMATRR
jgi:peptide/nickel transport system permease protein